MPLGQLLLSGSLLIMLLLLLLLLVRLQVVNERGI